MNWSNNLRVRQAAESVAAGGVIAYPTEAVWGLGCDPWNRHAVERLLAIKQRPERKGLIMVAGDMEQVAPLLHHLTPEQRQTLESAWPAPITYLIPNPPGPAPVPKWVTGEHPAFALRVSKHPLIKALCGHLGFPIISTSANPAQLPPARTRFQTVRYFYRELDFITPGETLSLTNPSEIRDLVSNRVIRPS